MIETMKSPNSQSEEFDARIVNTEDDIVELVAQGRNARR
jgi:hypothetical protein